MDINYDTWNLRHEACFSTSISPGVFWLPYSYLGQTEYTNEEMQKISLLSPEKKYIKIHNVYEAIQLFQNSRFEIDSKKHTEIDPDSGLEWEYQMTPYNSHIQNRGSCSEIASWAYYLLNNKYDEVGYLIINRSRNGHIINYVRLKNKLYFFDLNVNHLKYKGFVPIENGLRTELYKNMKFFTGILTMSESFDDYIKYHNKIARAHNSIYLFCKFNSTVLPPIAQKEAYNIVYKIIPKGSDIEIMNEINNIKLVETAYDPFILLSDKEKQLYI